MRLRRRVAGAVGVLLVAVALSVGAGNASASPTASLKLYLGCVGGDGRNWDYTLVVQGTTSYYDDHDGARLEYRVWGDDSFSDDFLAGPYFSRSFFGSFYTGICINKSTLNEDWGQDEIYVGVRVYDPTTGQLVEKVETNRITGYF